MYSGLHLIKPTSNNPQPVGMNARQQMSKSVKESLQMFERVMMQVRMLRNIRTLKSLNRRWKRVLSRSRPLLTACSMIKNKIIKKSVDKTNTILNK